MNVNLELYKIFLTVAKNNSITKAANELMISQPGISKSIKNLESQLKCSLFIRTKRGVILTEEGKVFYSKLSDAMQLIDNAEKSLTEMINLECGNLNIGISNTLTKNFLLNYLDIFHKMYPKIKIKIHTEPTTELLIKARNGIIDFIILNLPYDMPTDFYVKRLKTIQDCFVANNDYIYLKDKQIPLTKLNNYPLILISKGSNTRYFLDNFCSKNKTTLIAEMELASYSLVTHFIKKGFGIGLVTKDFIKEDLKNGNLFELQVLPKIDKRYIGVAYPKSKVLRYCATTFLKIIENNK